MTACSYLTLSRFDDDQTLVRRQRVKSVDDIRERIRHQLMRERLQSRVEMLQNNRRSLCIYDDDEYNGFSQQRPFEETDTTTSDTISNPAWHSDYEEEEANPWCLSSQSSASTCPSPALMEGPSSPSTPNPQANRQRRQHTPLSAQRHYKACQTSTRSSPSPRFAQNNIQVIQEFNSFKIVLAQMGPNETERIGEIINDGWKILLNACQSTDKDIQYEALKLVSSMANQKLILPQTIVHLLQHGLVYGLVDGAFNIQGGFKTIVDLFIDIARSLPQVIPYMIEIISTSKMATYFEEILSTGSYEEQDAVLTFYCGVTETLLNQFSSNQQIQPQLPDILIKTGVSRETLESYGPLNTLIRCFSPVMICNIVTKCLTRHKLSEGDTITQSLLLLANAIKLIHIVSAYNLENYEAAIIELITAICRSNIEQSLASLIKGSERLIKTAQSSEHSSQGIGICDLGSTNLKRCNQFIQFYQQCFGPLYCKYSHKIEEERFTESPKSVMEAW